MAYSLVGSAGTVATGTTSVTPTYPQTPTANNLLVAICAAEPIVQPATPAGWSGGNGVVGVGIFYKVAAGGDSQPTFQSAGTAFTNCAAMICEFSGNDITAPGDQVGQTQGATSTQTATAGAVDTAIGELFVVAWKGSYSMAATKTTSFSFNNASVIALRDNDATSDTLHYRFAYGTTTSNAAADSATTTFTITSINSNGATTAVRSFLLGAPGGVRRKPMVEPLPLIPRGRSM